jgi:hypothetical protein
MSALDRLRGRSIPRATIWTQPVFYGSDAQMLCFSGSSGRGSGKRRETTRPKIRAAVVTESLRLNSRELPTGLKISADSFGELPPFLGPEGKSLYSHKESSLKCCF